eukprot:SAG11_NODE_2294_length_3556_cov_3.734741_4_plen_205_part_00
MQAECRSFGDEIVIHDTSVKCLFSFGVSAAGSPVDDSFFAPFRQAGKPVWATVQAYAGQAEAPELCTDLVGRKHVIAEQMVATARNAKLTGYNIDWETGRNNSVACFVELWSSVGAALRQHGIQLNTDIDQSCLKLPGFPGPACGPTEWSYLWNFDAMIVTFDSFTEMATVTAGLNRARMRINDNLEIAAPRIVPDWFSLPTIC